jgi:hypothetical protein
MSLYFKIPALIAVGIAFAWVASVGVTTRFSRLGRFDRITRVGLFCIGFFGCGTFYGWAIYGGPWDFWALPYGWTRSWIVGTSAADGHALRIGSAYPRWDELSACAIRPQPADGEDAA